MKQVTLGYYEILEIGYNLSMFLNDNGINDSELVLKVPKQILKKIDEDVFYRNQHETKNEDKYVPTEQDVILTFKNITIRLTPIEN